MRIEDYFRLDPDGWVRSRDELGGKVSQFGGGSDPLDSGQTASGFSTKDHPNAPYCAMPVRVLQRFLGYPIPTSRRHSWAGWGQAVKFALGNKVAWAYLRDEGPAERYRGRFLGRIGDVGPYVMNILGGDGLIGGVHVAFRPGSKVPS